MTKTKNLPTLQCNCKYLLFTILTAFFLLISLKTPLFAQSTLSIGRAPSSEKLQLLPGETHTGEIVVWSFAPTIIDYNVVITGFKQIENHPGTAIMLTETSEEKSPYSALSWVTVETERISLAPNKNQKIFYDIKVPHDVAKGEYYVMIAFLSDTEYEMFSTGAYMSLSSGTPILIKVGDSFMEEAELISFQVDKRLYEFPKVRFETRISNTGETHITPVGEIHLTNIFKQDIATIPFNENLQSTLREEFGNYETMWNYGSFLTPEKKLVLGPIDAKLILTYRSTRPGFAPLMADTSFWIIPWRYILLAILIIVTTTVVVKIYKKKKQKQEQNIKNS